jgi:tetratricopeptide (TPR) repeat protein
MMKKLLPILLGILLACQLSAQNRTTQLLDEIFADAEQCYLMDDYRQLQKWIQLYGRFFDYYKDDLGDSTDVYAAYLAKMKGSYYYGFADLDDEFYEESEQQYKASLAVFNKRHNVTNAVVIHEELAQLYYKMKDYYKAKMHLDSAWAYYNERLNIMGVESVKPDYYRTLTQMAMCNARTEFYGLALLQIERALKDYYKKNKDDGYYETLRKKGKILMCQADSYGNTDYKEAVNCYQQYVKEYCNSIEKRMAGMTESQRNQYWLSMHQFLYDCFRLGNRAPEMLYDLTLFSKDYLVRKQAEPTTWKQIRQVLGKNECAIEFVQYFGKDDEKRLGCLILKHNSKKPFFLDLYSIDSLLNLPLTDRYTIGEALDETYDVYVKDTLYTDNRVPGLFWTKPLMDAIGDARKVYFAPDGLLNLVPIEYLMPDPTKVCYRLSSTRTLLRKHVAPKMESALLFGGMEYEGTYVPIGDGNDVLTYRHLASDDFSVTYLPGTKEEVIGIYKIRNKPTDVLMLGSAATDEVFLNLLKLRFDVIHITTHGFYDGHIEVRNDLKPFFCDHSLSECGVLFAGSTNTLTDTAFDENMSDGVLSAAEFAQQDLSSTELIILNACETGLGLVTEDGICGIQRGLKQAGVGGMLLTLWSVLDDPSCMIMQFFYEELEKQQTKDIHAAFLKARKRLKEEEKIYMYIDGDGTLMYEKYRFNRPQDVNAYILIDVF